MDRIQKLLQKISPADRKKILTTLQKIYERNPDLTKKKLKGFEALFRVRVGNFRIIYFDDGKKIKIKHIKKRNESTYSDI